MKLRVAAPLALLCCGLIYGQGVPKADLFLGYSFLRANSAREIPAFTMNGGVGTLGVNINKHFGLEAEFGGHHNGNIHGIESDTTTLTYLFGPRIAVGRGKKVDPYFHVLFGGVHFTTSVSQQQVTLPTGPAPASGRYAASQDAFTMAAGGGLDIRLGHHVSFRPIQLDYVVMRLQDFGLTGQPSRNRNQNNLRYAGGFLFTFGAERATPPPPTTKPCPGGISVPADQDCPKRDISLGLTSDQTEVCAGTNVTVKPAANLPADATQQWTVNGEPAAQAGVFEFKTDGLAPGPYKVGLKASGAAYNDAFAETQITVRGYQAPSGTVQVTPAEIWAGEKATIMPSFQPGQCGGALQSPKIEVSEGTVDGNTYDSSAVAFDPANTSEQQKKVIIAASVSDGKEPASAQTPLIVKKKGAIAARRLPDVVFPVGSDRVNNCGKRLLLEELKALTENDPTGTVVFVGHQTDRESKWAGLDEKRALNAAAVISAGQGICTNFPASRIQVSAVGATQNGVEPQPHFCGTSVGAERAGQGVSDSDAEARYRRVEVWFVPTGGAFPGTVGNYKDAATLSAGALGCPK